MTTYGRRDHRGIDDDNLGDAITGIDDDKWGYDVSGVTFSSIRGRRLASSYGCEKIED